MRDERGRAGRWTRNGRRATAEDRRALVAALWDGRTRARRKAARSTCDRQTWNGRMTRSAAYTWVLADFHQYKGCDTHCTRQVHMVHGSWSMGMSTDAQTGLLNCLGMGGTWVLMGSAHGKANWTANVQAGMCTHVARGVSVTLFLPNCAIRQAGQRCVHGACLSVRLCVRLRGHEKVVGRHGRRSRARGTTDCMGMEIRGTARTVSRVLGTVDCLSSARIRLRLLVRLCVRLRLHVCVRSTATACLRSVFDCDCMSCGHEKHGHEKGALRSFEQRLLVCVCVTRIVW